MRHWVTIAAGFLTAALLLAAQARAQSPSPDAMAAAKELVEASKTTDAFKTLLPMMMQQIKPVVVQKRPAVEKDFDQIVPLMIEAANEQVGKFAEGIAVIWASNFTADELRQVSAFYRTPAGQKFLQQMPVIAQQSMAMGQKFGESLMNDLQGRMKDELRKRGHKI
ncbi:MAG TPA: DUF2059 domain-containing protein [Pseudorhodoplanes sp.]|nr:DUF2059 domain-containing protein [Pseudorhodoplanes sp.]